MPTLVRQMNISHQDFFRLLPKAVKSYAYQQHGQIITVSMPDGGQIIITLSEQRLQKIASLVLPLTDVTFEINHVAQKTQQDFFTQFDRAYQRIGG